MREFMGDKLPRLTLAELERQRIEECLSDHRGNKTHAANELAISTRTLQRKLREWEKESGPETRQQE